MSALLNHAKIANHGQSSASPPRTPSQAQTNKPSPPHETHIHTMQSQIWGSTIPLSITHPSSETPYLISVPRLSYLPLLLPRLTSFFGPASSFSYQDILLKNLPVGLLYDLYQPELPWPLELGDGPLFDIHDTYINSVKEVCLPVCWRVEEEVKADVGYRQISYAMEPQREL